MKPKTTLVLLLVLLLCAGTVALGVKLVQTTHALQTARAQTATRQINDRVLDFAQLFVADVLQASQEVDFETRLKLENAVRSIGDPEILAQWQRFIGSPDPTTAQAEVKKLLELLITRIRTQ